MRVIVFVVGASDRRRTADAHSFLASSFHSPSSHSRKLPRSFAVPNKTETVVSRRGLAYATTDQFLSHVDREQTTTTASPGRRGGRETRSKPTRTTRESGRTRCNNSRRGRRTKISGMPPSSSWCVAASRRYYQHTSYLQSYRA